jgi:hypothetical protein
MLPLAPFDLFEGDDEEARDPEEENQKEEDYCRRFVLLSKKRKIHHVSVVSVDARFEKIANRKYQK